MGVTCVNLPGPPLAASVWRHFRNSVSQWYVWVLALLCLYHLSLLEYATFNSEFELNGKRKEHCERYPMSARVRMRLTGENSALLHVRTV